MTRQNLHFSKFSHFKSLRMFILEFWQIKMCFLKIARFKSQKMYISKFLTCQKLLSSKISHYKSPKMYILEFLTNLNLLFPKISRFKPLKMSYDKSQFAIFKICSFISFRVTNYERTFLGYFMPCPHSEVSWKIWFGVPKDLKKNDEEITPFNEICENAAKWVTDVFTKKRKKFWVQ